MKETIEAKIKEIVDHIIDKPIVEVTLDDYTILKNELMEIRNMESKADNGKRMAELVALVANNSSPVYGNVN